MNLSKFKKQAISLASIAAVFVSTTGPAVAAIVPANGRFPAVTENTVVVTFVDNDGDLQNQEFQLDVSDSNKEYDFGTVYLYGNGDDDELGDMAYESVTFDFSNLDSVTDETLRSAGVLVRDESQRGDPIYKAYAAGGNASNQIGADDQGLYEFDYSDKVPSFSVGSIESMLEDAVEDATVTPAGFADGTEVITLDLTETISSSSDVPIGDPDRLEPYMEEVLIYVDTTDEEYAFKMDVEFVEDVPSDLDVPEIPEDSLKVVARHETGRVTFEPPMDMMGIVDYLVEIDGPSLEEYLTHNTVMFFPTTVTEEYTVTVYTVNAEGEESDGIESDSVDSDTIDMDGYFDDVTSDNIFLNYVGALVKLGIVDGNPDGATYGVDDEVSRGAMAKFVYNACQPNFNIGGELFPDVPVTDTFFPYIQSLKNAGVVGGYSDGEYKPGEMVSREQVTAFVARAATYFDEDSLEIGSGGGAFPDVDSSNIFADYIDALANHTEDEYQQIIGGYSDGMFHPGDPLTKGQMSKIIMNSIALIDMNDDGDTDNGTSFINEVFEIFDATQTMPGTFDTPETVFLRPFVHPTEVEGFTASSPSGDYAFDSIQLEWDAHDDVAIDGYVIEQKDADEDDDAWEAVDGQSTYTRAEYRVSVGADATTAIPAGETVIVSITVAGTTDVAEFTYTSPLGGATAADAVASLIAGSGDADLGFDGDVDAADATLAEADFSVTADPDSTNSVRIVVDASVVDADLYDIEVTANTTDSTFTGTISASEMVMGGSIIDSEGIVRIDQSAGRDGSVANVYPTSVVIEGLNDDESYDFRISPFKYVPIGYTADEDITTPTDLVSAVDEMSGDRYENIILVQKEDEWSYETHSTDEDE